MALLEVVLNMSYFGQNCVNRWNYVSGGTPAAVTPSFGLAEAFGAVYDAGAIPPAYPEDTIMAALATLVVPQCIFQQITVLNVYDPLDFYQTPFVPAYVGSASGEPSTPTNAYGFRTNIVNRSIRRGTKRFVGVPTNVAEDGGVIIGTVVPFLEELADLMSSVLSYDDEGNELTYTPAVCSKEKYEVVDSDPVTFAYRYYPTLAEQLARTATSFTWEHYPTIRTQTSRQYGRGS